METRLQNSGKEKISFDGIEYYRLESIQLADEDHHEMPWARCAQDISDENGRYQCIAILFDKDSRPVLCTETPWRYILEEDDFESMEW